MFLEETEAIKIVKNKFLEEKRGEQSKNMVDICVMKMTRVAEENAKD